MVKRGVAAVLAAREVRSNNVRVQLRIQRATHPVEPLVPVAQHATLWRVLRPSDLYVLTGLTINAGRAWTLRQLASELHIDHTVVHRALERAALAGLYLPGRRTVNLAELEPMLVHAARFIAPAQLGELVAGVPAAWAAEPIVALIHEAGGDPPPVWPSAGGRVRGQAFPPLHPAAVAAAAACGPLAELLAVVDTLRTRDPRLRAVAATALTGSLRQLSSRDAAAA